MRGGAYARENTVVFPLRIANSKRNTSTGDFYISRNPSRQNKTLRASRNEIDFFANR